MNLQTLEKIETTNMITEQTAEQDHPTLTDTVRTTLLAYFNELEGSEPVDIYDMVLKQIEAPLLQVVMEQVDGNQTRAAAYLGLNRGTLRKKLKMYDLD